MRLCKECSRTPWPYLMVVFISLFAAFTTWLTLDSAGVSPEVNQWWTAGVAVTVGALLAGYMIGCIRRHCRHDHHHPA